MRHKTSDHGQGTNNAAATSDKEDLEEILRQTLLDLDAAFCRHWRNKKTQIAPGSTATVALVRGGYELVTGHIGESPGHTALDRMCSSLFSL